MERLTPTPKLVYGFYVICAYQKCGIMNKASELIKFSFESGVHSHYYGKVYFCEFSVLRLLKNLGGKVIY